MKNVKLVSILERFTSSKLNELIGDENLEIMQEWESKEKIDSLKKSDLAKIVYNIYGDKLIDDEKNRFEILEHLNKDEYEEISKKLNKKVDYKEIKEIYSSKNWKNDIYTKVLLELLEINESVFDISKEDKSINILKSNNGLSKFYELQDYQFLIKQKVMNRLNKNHEIEKMLINMPTGTGKTKTCMHIITDAIINILKNKGLVIWIADTSELLEQAYSTFKNVWSHIGNQDIKSYKLYGKYNFECNDIEDGIVFAGIQKLNSMKNKKDLLFDKLVNESILIVYDEAHKIVAYETKKTVEELMLKKNENKNKILIGLSATPGRTGDRKEIDKLVNFFNNNKFEIDIKTLNKINMSDFEYSNAKTIGIISYLQNRKILSLLKKEELEYLPIDINDWNTLVEKIRKSDKEISKSNLEKFAKEKSRNKAIIEKLLMLNEKKIPTLVFACSVEHAKLIANILTIKGVNNTLILGETETEKRINEIENFKNGEVNILINCNVLTTGFDATNIECVFITRPTKSIILYSQMIGRGLRGPKMGGSEECLLIDLKDNLQNAEEVESFSYFNKFWNGGK
ncbi:MAG: DEAD/DEAH box helicase [Clostridia bacterium]